MRWTENMMAALFCDGRGAHGYLRLSKNSSSASCPVDPAPLLDNSSTEVTIDVPEVTLRELKKATRSFSDKMLVGEGRYAKVYKASLPSGITVAAKRLGTPSAERWKASDAGFLMRQVSIASRLRHDNLVRFLGYNITADLHVLLFEFASVGTLHEALHGLRREPPGRRASAGACRSWPTLNWVQRVQIALDAAKGLAYLHESEVTHHDIRSTNVLLFQGFRAKIADYDLYKQLPSEDVEKNYMVEFTRASNGYWSPEYAFTGHTTQKSDVFSFGVLLLELLTGIRPSDWKMKSAVDRRAAPRMDPKLGRRYPRAGARKLAMIALRCLCHKPACRPSMATVAGEIQEVITGGERC